MKIKAQDIRIGNYHESPDISHPRLGFSSVKIDGKAFAAIAIGGLESLSRGQIEFMPIPISAEWLTKFGFTDAPWYKKKLKIILDGATSELVIGKWIDGWVVSITETREQYIPLKDQAEMINEMVKCNEEIQDEMYSGQSKEADVSIAMINYVHELQNIWHSLTREELILNTK